MTHMNSKKKLNIVCVGAGYVGGPTMAVIADKCPFATVHVFDILKPRIEAWNSPKPSSPDEPDGLPIFEPGLSDVIYKVRGNSMFFTTDPNVLQKADIIFIAVNTPTKERGIGIGCATDLSYFENSIRLVGNMATEERDVIIVEKSTVPVRSAIAVEQILSSFNSKTRFKILSNPEFLAEGTAIQDLLNPDRILIGGADLDAVATLSSIYECWVPKERIVTTNLWSSELSKLAANAFLAQRISSINSISAICEKTNANIMEISRAVGSDKRIGNNFLNPSPGFGGSCFKKDILSLVYLCEKMGLHEVAEYWNQVIVINEYQKERVFRKVVDMCFNTVNRKNLAIYGFTFKKNTGDTRESPAIHICSRLLAEGAILRIYDPKVSENAVYSELANYIISTNENINIQYFSNDHQNNACKFDLYDGKLTQFLKKNIKFMRSALDAAQDASAILILTDWDEFRSLNYKLIYDVMDKPAMVFNGHPTLDLKDFECIGFNTFSLGEYTHNLLFNSSNGYHDDDKTKNR
ncbi:unnamed protein product [Phytomonas sp. Hart1]|nr:unnamed protein product [Phytomonas sp. Hart1]|eukprot:CCW66912.1 unnamed protein product [Phytomonas sp. isolate Hart1]